MRNLIFVGLPGSGKRIGVIHVQTAGFLNHGNCIYIFPYPFYEENSSQYNNCCNDQDPFCKKKFSEEIFLLQLLFSFPYFSFHNSESFPVHLAKIIQGMTGKFKMSRAVLEIQFLDLEKGRNLFS